MTGEPKQAAPHSRGEAWRAQLLAAARSKRSRFRAARARHLLSTALVPALLLLTLTLVATGALRSPERLPWPALAGAFLVVLALPLNLAARAIRGRRRWGAWRFDGTGERQLELGALLLCAAWVVIEVLGSELHALVYVIVAAWAGLKSSRLVIPLVAIALLFEVASLYHSPALLPNVALQTIFVLLFAALYGLLSGAEVVRARRVEREALSARIRTAEEQAIALRLDPELGAAPEEVRAHTAIAAAGEIESAISSALDVMELALGAEGCAVYLLSPDGKYLRLHDGRSTDRKLRRDPIPATDGLLGFVVSNGGPLASGEAPVERGVNWYEDGRGVSHFAMAPLLAGGESGALRGLLLVDRTTPGPFSERERELLALQAAQILRTIDFQRDFSSMKRLRDEKERLFDALRELNATMMPADVIKVALAKACTAGALDFVAITGVEEQDGLLFHQIIATTEEHQALKGKRWPDNGGLVSDALHFERPWPVREKRTISGMVVFDDTTKLHGLESLKVFPLRTGKRHLGTLVAGTERRGAFDLDLVATLEVLALQTAQSLERASLFEQMEQMATTDGLTGLLNHRTFQGRLEEELKLAQRYGRTLSILLTDIDHFKRVNDTYGHPMGDTVLRGVARILKRTARETDAVSRYGGEEFCVVMPETNLSGATTIAERIRREVERATFETPEGPLQVTISIGLATWRPPGLSKQELIDRADQCLYHAKHSGRNRTVSELPLSDPSP